MFCWSVSRGQSSAAYVLDERGQLVRPGRGRRRRPACTRTSPPAARGWPDRSEHSSQSGRHEHDHGWTQRSGGQDRRRAVLQHGVHGSSPPTCPGSGTDAGEGGGRRRGRLRSDDPRPDCSGDRDDEHRDRHDSGGDGEPAPPRGPALRPGFARLDGLGLGGLGLGGQGLRQSAARPSARVRRQGRERQPVEVFGRQVVVAAVRAGPDPRAPLMG